MGKREDSGFAQDSLELRALQKRTKAKDLLWHRQVDLWALQEHCWAARHPGQEPEHWPLTPVPWGKRPAGQQ